MRSSSGGVRVQSRVTETPIEENVELREEHVHIERYDTDYSFRWLGLLGLMPGKRVPVVREVYDAREVRDVRDPGTTNRR